LLETLDAQVLAFRDDVLAGLSARSRDPSAGSTTGAARAIRRDHASSVLLSDPPETAIFHDIMPRSPRAFPRAQVVEFGAGSATKTPILLEAISPAAYIPVDIRAII
jgi:hypothetical protein